MQSKLSLTSKTLDNLYQNFILDVEGKKIPIPYRINIPANEHPVRQGKSSPEVILTQLKKDAKDQGFNLRQATVAQTRRFMVKNRLGIDCSGFSYRMVDYLLNTLNLPSLAKSGFPHVGRTNVVLLTSSTHTITINQASMVRVGDLIKIGSQNKIPHCMIVVGVNTQEIIYAHSSSKTKVTGVHIGKIKILDPALGLEAQEWEEPLFYNPTLGDRASRLKILEKVILC